MSAPDVNTLAKAAIICRKVASYCREGMSNRMQIIKHITARRLSLLLDFVRLAMLIVKKYCVNA